jgi:UDP-2,4-diacetamido-2,4,6-trideoxy-beta-L-altropyranose hydrolase
VTSVGRDTTRSRGGALVRVDASPSIGFGHLSRCLAVAAGLDAHGWSVEFVTRKPSVDKVRDAGFGIRLLEDESSPENERTIVARLAHSLGARLVVVDHYEIDGAYHAALRATGATLVVIDDLGRHGVGADIVVNQNIFASETLYPEAGGCRLLLGPRFALLRPEFAKYRRQTSSDMARVPSVLVTLGGGETSDMTVVAVQGLLRVRADIEIVAVLGPGVTDAKRVEDAARGRVNVVRDPEDMAGLMSRCDVAICGGGATCWELACLGVPSLVIVMADNQRRNADGLAEAGITMNLGEQAAVTPAAIEMAVERLLRDPEPRRRMADRGQALVDGHGVERLMAEIERR